MIKKLLLGCLLTTSFSYCQTQIGNIYGTSNTEQLGYSVSISGNGNEVAIGAYDNDDFYTSGGALKVFNYNVTNWSQIGQTMYGDSMYDELGWSVSLSDDGNIVAVGIPSADGLEGNYPGRVRVFQKNNNQWIQLGTDIIGTINDFQFGERVSISENGQTLAITSLFNNINGPNSGQVRVYNLENNNWVQLGNNISGSVTSLAFGKSLSISGDGTTIAVGTPINNENGTNSGEVKVFRLISNTWTSLGDDINGEITDDRLGESVSLSYDGNTLAIGCIQNVNNTGPGKVKIYNYSSNTWNQLGNTITGQTLNDAFGYSVSISNNGNFLAVGAPGKDVSYYIDAGASYLFKYESGSWIQVGNPLFGDYYSDYFGISVSLSNDGSKLAAGAYLNDYAGYANGLVKIYDYSTLLNNSTFILDNFSIYPNPTVNEVSISLSNALNLEKVNIYNQLGQFIKSEQKKCFSVSELAKGTYFIEVITNQGKTTNVLLKD